jgi:hypothetical protein
MGERVPTRNNKPRVIDRLRRLIELSVFHEQKAVSGIILLMELKSTFRNLAGDPKKKTVHCIAIVLIAIASSGCERPPKEVERPEKIVSLRQVVYDSATYAKLSSLWEKYYDVYPSEDAYANWMYASRYAKLSNYKSMLEKGVEKYPSNPVLLYLVALANNAWQLDMKSQQFLERASALDPEYMDPWYGLVITYLAHGNLENADAALRRLLSGKAVEDEVMDFSYNMIASMDSNAILITNGDNDTYPGWILTRIIRYRPDVKIVNRTLLNTDWYPMMIMKEGVPTFTNAADSDSLRKQVSADMEAARIGKVPYQEVALLGDRLVVRLIEAAQRAGRPVYFSRTLEPVDLLQKHTLQGRQLGLVTLVTPTSRPYPTQVHKLLAAWVTEFRTSGLDSWHLRSAKEARAGRMLVRNYATALKSLKPQIQAAGPQMQLEMFRWYRTHLLGVIPKDLADEVNGIWCTPGSPREIHTWWKEQGLMK